MGRLNLIERRIRARMRQPPSVRNAAGVIVVASGRDGCGALISLIDSDEYPNVGIGLWWAIQTVTTVGYGDVAPKDVVGRVVAALVMLYGIAFIAIVTAVITSTFVARASRDYDAAHREEEQSDRELMEKRFDELEQKLDALIAAQEP
jgi:voltage-gated potassium channel Kch